MENYKELTDEQVESIMDKRTILERNVVKETLSNLIDIFDLLSQEEGAKSPEEFLGDYHTLKSEVLDKLLSEMYVKSSMVLNIVKTHKLAKLNTQNINKNKETNEQLSVES